MTIGELLELQAEIWYDYILITTKEKNDPIYKFKSTDNIPVGVLNKPASHMNVVRSGEYYLDFEILYLVIFL